MQRILTHRIKGKDYHVKERIPSNAKDSDTSFLCDTWTLIYIKVSRYIGFKK
jgi:hypothetical protein